MTRDKSESSGPNVTSVSSVNYPSYALGIVGVVAIWLIVLKVLESGVLIAGSTIVLMVGLIWLLIQFNDC